MSAAGLRLRPPPGGAIGEVGDGGTLDATGILTTFLILLFAIPAPMVVAALGSAGNPATMLAFAAAFLWCWYQVSHREVTQDRQPVRIAMFAFILVMVVVYAHAMTRAIPQFEVSPADSAMLRLFAVMGLALLAHDGLGTRDRFHTLLRRMAVGAGLTAFLALAQFASGQLIVDRMQIPGLVWATSDQVAALARNGMTRASGTATSPIELGVVLAMMLPTLITVTRHSGGTRRRLYGAMTAAAGFACFLTVSRSALLTVAVSLGVMLPAWTPRVRRTVFVLGLGVVAAVAVAAPGLLRTFQALFMGVESDPSTLSRTESFAYAAEFITRSPWLGRGLGTFLPEYHIFDNEYLLLVVEAGVVGLVAWLVLAATSVVSARRARLLAVSDLDREAAQAMAAAVAAGTVGAAFFDLFGFPIVTGLLFVAMGMCGASLRLARREAAEAVDVSPRSAPGPTS